MNKLFYFLYFVILSATSIYAQGTFTFSTSTLDGNNVEETVNTVLLTVSCPGTVADNTTWDGYAGTSGRVAYNLNTASASMVLAFNKTVTISSLRAGDCSGGTTEDWVFTPTPNNGTVTATVPADDGVTVNFNSNFADITAITITRNGGGSTFFLIDDVVMDSHLPVELTSFAAVVINNTIKLKWKTVTEVNNYGFDVECVSSSPGIKWEKIGFVQGSGNSNSIKEYSFIDSKISKSIVRYRLKQIDFDGNYKYSNEVEIKMNGSARFSLEQNYPNPFNPATTISFEVDQNSFISLTVFNIIGETVKVLINEYLEKGVYSYNFDAGNLPTGTYIYSLKSGNNTITKKMNLIK
jgi:hypothetical protein